LRRCPDPYFSKAGSIWNEQKTIGLCRISCAYVFPEGMRADSSRKHRLPLSCHKALQTKIDPAHSILLQKSPLPAIIIWTISRLFALRRIQADGEGCLGGGDQPPQKLWEKLPGTVIGVVKRGFLISSF